MEHRPQKHRSQAALYLVLIGALLLTSLGDGAARAGARALEQAAEPASAAEGWQVLAGGHTVPAVPSGIAVDPAGNVFVTDSANNRVLKLSPQGDVLEEWGGSEDVPVQFATPAGVAIDGDGALYVADTGHHRIVKLSPVGEVLAQWGQGGTALGELRAPSGVAVDRDGAILVADAGNHRIVKLAPADDAWTQWGTEGPNLGEFRSPAAVAVDQEGLIYVADSGNGRIQQFTESGQPVRDWSARGRAAGPFIQPSGLAVDASNTVYVIGGGNRWVLRFSSSGELLGEWGDQGATSAQLNGPLSIAVDAAGDVYVADSGRLSESSPEPGDRSARVRRFTPEGDLVAHWPIHGSSGKFDRLTGIAVDGNGTIYVADTGNYRVQKLAPSGAPIAEWHSFGGRRVGRGGGAAPTSLAVDAAGQIYVADAFNRAVWKLAADGEILDRWSASGEQLSASFRPSAVAVDSAQTVHVSDGPQIQTFSPAGEPVARWEPRGACNGKLSNNPRITFDSQGNSYIADSGNSLILKLSPAGDLLALWALQAGQRRISPRAVAVDPTGNIYVAGSNHIQMLAPSGAMLAEWGPGTKPGQFNSPGGLAIDQAGSLYVADTGNNRIQKLPAAAMSRSTTAMSQAAPTPRCFSEGNVTEYRQDSPYHPTMGPDGSLWYSTFGGDIELKRLAADGTVTQVTSGDTWFLTAGPGGTLWYTGTSRVARLGADGRITDYALPTSNTQTRGITAGPDGSMWYVGSDRIGRIAPDGAITEYPVRTPTVKLWSITPGPDGALWFIDQRAELVGRITTSGTITEYPVPPADRAASPMTIGPSYSGATIVTGPDDALWFTRPVDGQIGRISTQGTFTTYQIPWAGACPLGIAAGADAALWFTDRCGEQIGRVTTAGTIEAFWLSTSPDSAPWYIAAGSDGALWVTATRLVARIAIAANQPAGVPAAGTAVAAPAPTPRPAIPGPGGRPAQRPFSPPPASPMEAPSFGPWR